MTVAFMMSVQSNFIRRQSSYKEVLTLQEALDTAIEFEIIGKSLTAKSREPRM